MSSSTSLDNTKQKLALAYKILAKLKLDDHTYTHLSARFLEQLDEFDPINNLNLKEPNLHQNNQKPDSYLIYEFGLRFSEVKPDNLIRISIEGEIIEGIDRNYNITGYNIHGSIYKARPDINAVFHLHTPATVAVSAMKKGLMPISQWALHFYNTISYHDYNSLVLNPEQNQNLIADLGPNNFVMFLRNHGFIACGRTIEEAMFYTYHLEQACKTQCLALSCNQELIIPSEDICQKTVDDLLGFEQNLGARDWEAWVRLIES